MFRKLRLKLTIVNSAIILALFLLLGVGVYAFSHVYMDRRADAMAKMLSADILSGRLADFPERRPEPGGRLFGPPPPESPGPPGSFPKPPPGRLSFFFVKTSPAGAVDFSSSNQPLDQANLASLTAKALQADKSQGIISLEQTDYSFWKTPLTAQPGTLLVFHDTSQEASARHTILTALIAVGVVCSLLSFAASFFLANRAMVPIRTAWRQQLDFLSDASHELRTPLAVIQTNLDIALGNREETIASQHQWLDNIREETVHMAKLVDSLLFLARADSRQHPLATAPFSLATALSRAVAPFEPLAAAKGLTLSCEVNSAFPARGDEARIRQVINILLDNAIRHTPPGGRIAVSLAKAGDANLITVADTGEGIEAQYLEKIFDRFFQVDKSRSNGGAGLGLSIAKWIVESHGGAITAASVPGAGTTFAVRLPDKS